MRHENDTINYFRELSRMQAPEIQELLLLRLFLNLLADRSFCSRILSIRLLDKELVQRSEKELGSDFIKIRQLHSEFVKQSRNGNDWGKQELDAVRKRNAEADSAETSNSRGRLQNDDSSIKSSSFLAVPTEDFSSHT